jgi:lipopolysaccharide transport system permease protein
MFSNSTLSKILRNIVVELPATPIRHWALIRQFSAREIASKYQGSLLGFGWTFAIPLMMLTIYTFVFSTVFRSRWPGGSESQTEFAILIYAGLIVFGFFGEVIGRAPRLIMESPNLVKKVAFPLETLAWIAVGTAGFNALINLAILAGFMLFINGSVPLTAVLAPLVLLPLAVLSLGLAWIISALGVYLRDLSQLIGVLISALLFITPIFYPISAVPANFQTYLRLNPLTYYVETLRETLIWGKLPNAEGFVTTSATALVVCTIGFIWFRYARRGFADVM